jgi:hypothetical protein
MKHGVAIIVTATAILIGCGFGAAVNAQSTKAPAGSPGSDIGVSGAIEQKLLLTPAQRSAIYAEVSKDKSKSSPKDFAPVVGSDVPPMIEHYALPDDTLTEVPEAKLYKYTMLENKVVVVDPIRMRVIDVIGPAPPQ